LIWTWGWAATALVLGATIALSETRWVDVTWRVAAVTAGVLTSIVAQRTLGMSRVLAIAFTVAGIRTATLNTSVEPGLPSTLTWAQAGLDLLAGPLLVAIILLALRVRRGRLGLPELLDGAIVAIAAGLCTWIVLAGPAWRDGTDLILAIAASIFLPVGMMLVTFTSELMLEGLTRNRTMLMLLVATVGALGAGVVRALHQLDVIGAHGLQLSSAIYVTSFLVACASVGHASAASVLQRCRQSAPRAGRETLAMAPLAVSLTAVAVFSAVFSVDTRVDMAVRSIASALLIVLVLARLYAALERSASVQRMLQTRLDRDDLTGLLNRSRFTTLVDEVLESTWRSERHPTLVQINLDRFKNINDTIGYDAANRLLVALGERLAVVAASFDGLAARLGGDDFLVLDHTTRTPEDAARRADALRNALAEPFELGEALIHVMVSIGVVTAPENRTVNADEMIRRAAIATHRAKADGRGRVVIFDESMQAMLQQRMSLEHALHGAIGRQELQLYYQPIIDVCAGRLSGFEALLRWKRADGTMVSPVDFIPVAEETGLIIDLGGWALNTALADLRLWIDDGMVPATATMSVNVSPVQMMVPNFVDVVADSLDRNSMPAHLLWLEMTESMMLDNPDQVEATLRRIRATGVRLALDDFGTGYSSLSMLQRFPIQRIKIDRAFVNGIAERSNDRSLVRTIIAMGQSMGLDLVAEGVETVHQLQSLQQLGCDKAQGFLISRPVPADAMRSTMSALAELVELSLFEPAASQAPLAPNIDWPAQTASIALGRPAGVLTLPQR
jgi:diguanylate cyclase (GGDEF)-like protein